MTLKEKLFRMQSEAPYMKKDSKAYNFNYVNEESVLAFVRPLLKELNIQAYPMIDSQQVERVETLVKGKTAVEFLFTGSGKVALIDGDSDEHVLIPWVFTGSNGDPSQAFGSAMTYCMRYFWLKFLQVPTGNDDPDKWRSESRKVDDGASSKSKTSTRVNTLSASQLNEFGDLVKNDPEPEKAKARLKKYVELLGVEKLSEVPADKFDDLKSAFMSDGLPFDM